MRAPEVLPVPREPREPREPPVIADRSVLPVLTVRLVPAALKPVPPAQLGPPVLLALLALLALRVLPVAAHLP